MRKLVDDNLIKVINTMSDTPYEEYNFTSTPMEGFQITQGGIDKDVDRMIITFEGKIEPYTQLSLTSIDSVTNVGTVSGDYRIDLHLPEIITEPFEIYGNSYYDNQPGKITYRIFIPDAYAKNLPLCLAFNEKTLAVKQWIDSPGGEYSLTFTKPEGYTSVEESWAFGYKQGMFYLILTSL